MFTMELAEAYKQYMPFCCVFLITPPERKISISPSFKCAGIYAVCCNLKCQWHDKGQNYILSETSYVPNHKCMNIQNLKKDEEN